MLMEHDEMSGRTEVMKFPGLQVYMVPIHLYQYSFVQYLLNSML